MLFLLLTGKGIHASVLLVPLAVLPLVLIMMGLSWAVAAIGVFFRDVGQVMPPLTTALLFLSPALYPLEMVPERFQQLLYQNPITPTIEALRQVIIHGLMPDMGLLLSQLAVGSVVFVLGHALFMRVRQGFADCL